MAAATMAKTDELMASLMQTPRATPKWPGRHRSRQWRRRYYSGWISVGHRRAPQRQPGLVISAEAIRVQQVWKTKTAEISDDTDRLRTRPSTQYTANGLASPGY